MPQLCVKFEGDEYQNLKLAVAIAGKGNLRAWAKQVLITKAQQTLFATQIKELPKDGVIPPQGVVILPLGATATQIPNPPKDPEKGEGGAT